MPTLADAYLLQKNNYDIFFFYNPMSNICPQVPTWLDYIMDLNPKFDPNFSFSYYVGIIFDEIIWYLTSIDTIY